MPKHSRTSTHAINIRLPIGLLAELDDRCASLPAGERATRTSLIVAAIEVFLSLGRPPGTRRAK